MKRLHGLCFSIGDSPKARPAFTPFLDLIRPHLTWGVRTYSTDGMPELGAAAHAVGLKLAAGGWLGADPVANARESARLIAMAQAGEVDLAVLGNETQFRKDMTAETLAAHLRAFKAAVPTVPLTTGDVADCWLEHPALMAAVDIVGMHHYPYWCGVPIEEAFNHFVALYARVKAVADTYGKPVWILETGWPSAGNPKGDAVPSPANAARYFREIATWAETTGTPLFYFEAFDEPWKQRDEGPQGAHWGIWTEDGIRKYWWEEPDVPRNILDIRLPLLFPPGFLWGTATSAHQVEGGKNGAGFSNWGTWEVSPQRRAQLAREGKQPESFVSGAGCDFRTRYADDFRIAGEFGHTAVRIGIDWAEVEPEPGRFDQAQLQRYRQMVDSARANGLEPVVTLFHWTHPGWFEETGGWKSTAAPALFERYAAAVLAELGAAVTWWTVLNEPNVYAFMSFAWGNWPPQENDPDSCALVQDHLVDAHRRAAALIRAAHPAARIGIAQSCGWNEADVPAEKERMDQWNYAFVDRIRDTLDFTGVNVYHHNVVTDGRSHNGWEGCDRCVETPVVSDLNWGMCPRSLAEVVREYWHRYRLPVMVTEHGQAVRERDDRRRCWFMWESLKWLHQVLAEGVPVLGYLHWSLIDNFEWASGYDPCFGLWSVDRQPGPRFLERTPRRSAHLLRAIIQAGGLTDSIAAEFAADIAAPVDVTTPAA